MWSIHWKAEKEGWGTKCIVNRKTSKISILVQAAITKHRRLGGLNNKHFIRIYFSQSQRMGSPRPGAPDSVSGESRAKSHLLTCAHKAYLGAHRWSVLFSLLLKALIPSWEGLGPPSWSPLNLITSQRPHFSITLGIRASTDLGDRRHFHLITMTEINSNRTNYNKCKWIDLDKQKETILGKD